MLWILVSISCVIFLYGYIIKPHKYWKDKNIPHEKPWPIFGSTARITFRKIPFSEGIKELCNKFNTRYFGMYQFLDPILVVQDLDLIKKISIKDFEYFLDHKTAVDDEVDPIFGKGLFQLKGKKWRNMRMTLSPVFTSSKMKSMFVLMSECADHFTNTLLINAKSDKQSAVEMKNLFTRCTNDVIATCIFGIKCDSITDPCNQFYIMGKEATNFEGLKSLKFFANSISPFLAKVFKIRIIGEKVTNYFRDVIKSTIQEREEKGIYRPDLIHLLMQARKGKLRYEETVKNKDDTGFATAHESDIGISNEAQQTAKELSLDDMTAQAMILFIGGFEVVSTLMCHMAHELAINPNIQEKLQLEIDDTIKTCENGKVTYDALTKMKYLDMVLCETLRKWPTATISERICTKTYTIEPVHSNEKPFVLHKGDQIWIPTVAIHRDPKYYPNPDKFDPERFSDVNKTSINPSAYIPFGSGPRNCIGSRFALLECKIVFVYLLSKMRLEVSEKTQIPLKLSTSNFNLVAENGFWLKLRPRNEKTC